MRHPWLLSTAAAAAFVALAAFSPPSSGEAPCSAAGGMGLDSAAGMPPDPCREGFAHASGYLAYLQARLALSGDQQPLWDKWQQKLQVAAMAEQTDCLADRARLGSKPNALQREDTFVRKAGAHLDAVKAARPELEALYGALTPGQQEIFDRLWPPLPPRLGGRRADAGKPGDKELPTPPLP
jgi:LTXXQ motif family protein